MKKTRVWFNHWFSTAYRIIELMKDGRDDLEIIGSNTNRYAVYKDVCDEFYVEPEFDKSYEYVEWCLHFCEYHEIDVFIPRRNFVLISEHKAKFEELGVKVLVSNNFELLKTLDNKLDTMDLFKALPNVAKIPNIISVTNVDGFFNAYKMLKNDSNRVCFKYAEDEGARSFRVVDDSVDGINSLNGSVGFKISYQKAMEMLGSVDEFKPLMVMEYLNGMEISVDCLATPKGFIAIPRYKVGGRVTKIDIDVDIINRAKAFYEHTKLDCPFNLQFRYHNNELCILEVNTRMSGGVHLSCLSGVNIPQIALKMLLGEDDYEVPTVDVLESLKVTHIETPIIIER